MSVAKVYVVFLVDCRYNGCDEWGMDEGEYIHSIWITYEEAVDVLEHELNMTKTSSDSRTWANEDYCGFIEAHCLRGKGVQNG